MLHAIEVMLCAIEVIKFIYVISTKDHMDDLDKNGNSREKQAHDSDTDNLEGDIGLEEVA
jgi:hypothetical protein